MHVGNRQVMRENPLLVANSFVDDVSLDKTAGRKYLCLCAAAVINPSSHWRMYGAVFGSPKETEQTAVSCLERTTAWCRWSRVAGNLASCKCMHASADNIETVRSSCLVLRVRARATTAGSNVAIRAYTVAPLDSGNTMNR